ncbi:MAG: adenylate/guanylate cyclase domain-containing protein, partial [Geminicoccaceae bacterium]
MRCGIGNAADRRYCGACGAALPIPCPGCGFVNEPGMAFCGGCGEALGHGARDRSNATPEHRQVAVLFVDLVGYTRLTAALGPEDTRTLLDSFFAAVDGVVERHGGSVAQHLGDCVMALFGAPTARGDDVDRAARAALAMSSAMLRLSTQVGHDLAVHVGIAVGDVVAGGTGSDAHRIYTVTGDAVNLAARLADRAASGELLIADAVRLALAVPAQLEDLGPISLEGIDRPIRVHRLVGLRDGPVVDAGAIVGRAAELDQLATLLTQARKGQGGLVLLRGDAGIGKSRLLREARVRAVRDGFACHLVLVLDFGSGEGREPIHVLTRGLLGVEPGDQLTELPVAAQAIPLREMLRPFLFDLLDIALPQELDHLVAAMADSERRSARQRALAAVIGAAAARQPLLLVVEDVHWADRDLLGDLTAIGRAIADLPALLVMSTRREGDPVDASWRASAGPAPLTTIDLHPLRDGDARRLATQLLAGTDELVAERCVARAQGNPLFLEQLSRHLRERGDDMVPATVQTLIQARLDRLEPSDREALRAASVLGQRFTLPALRAILGRVDYEPGQLIQRLLVRPSGDDFLFAHALIRDAVYDLLLRTRRRELHLRAAAYFVGQDAVLHAQHLDRAGEPTASAAYAVAAQQQAEAYRNESALELAARGLELATLPAERFSLACLVGRLQLDLGRAPAAEAAYAIALDLAHDAAERCRALLGLAAAMRLSDRFEEALARLGAAQDAASGPGLIEELSRIHHLRGNLVFPLGQPEECAREHETALRHARAAGSPELEARALGGLGDAEYARGRMISAHAAFVRCCELARVHGYGRIEAANRPMVAVACWYTLDLDRTLQESDAAVALALRVGHRRGAIIAHHAAVMSLLLRLDLGRAEARIGEAQALTLAIGARRFEAENLLLMAECRMLAGDRPSAAAFAEQAMALSRETAVQYFGPGILGMLAWTAGAPDTRAAAIAEAEALLVDGSLAHNFLLLRRYAIDAYLDAGDWDEADRHADALEDYAAAEPSPWTELFVARGRALAAHGRTPGKVENQAELR